MTTDQQTLKLEIKQWEHEFRKLEGRNPSKEDIKKDAAIASKYKQYNSTKLKALKPSSKEKKNSSKTEPLTPSKKANIQFSTPTKHRHRHREPKAHLETPHKTSPPLPTSPAVKELGPTPQLNGRVLSIFDVITTSFSKPETIMESQDLVTPTKNVKSIDFPIDMDSDNDSISSSPARLVLEEDEEINSSQQLGSQFKTPQKNRVVDYTIQETPAYLKTSTIQTATASPSPLASQRIKKGLRTLIDELRDIQDELKYGDFDEDELIPDGPLLSSSDDNGEAEQEDIELTEDKGKTKWKKKKRKGPKRQHRLVRIHALPSTENLEVIDENKGIKDQIEKLAPVKEEQVMDSDASEEWSDNDNEYVKQNVDFSTMQGKRKPAGVSRNFKAYKIQKSKFFGKRAKGW